MPRFVLELHPRVRANLRAIGGVLLVVALVAAGPLATPTVAPAAALPPSAAMLSGSPSRAVTPPPNTKPTITITPASGEFAVGAQVAVTVEYCDSQNLNLGTKTLTYNSAALSWKTTSTIGNPGPCLVRAVASGTVTVAQGSNEVPASRCSAPCARARENP